MRSLEIVLFFPCDFSSFFFAYHVSGILILNIIHLGGKGVRNCIIFLFLSFLFSLIISEPWWLCTRDSNPHLYISASFGCCFPNDFTMIRPFVCSCLLNCLTRLPFWPISNCSVLSLGHCSLSI